MQRMAFLEEFKREAVWFARQPGVSKTGSRSQEAFDSRSMPPCFYEFDRALQPATGLVARPVLAGTCSTSRRGNCWNNPAMENFFSTAKTGRPSVEQYRARDDPCVDVFDYIERFYNPKRRHSTIGYISPVQFENLQYA